MEDLNQTYANLLTDGSRLEVAYAVSSDGRYIVGSGYNARTKHHEAFLLDTAPSAKPEQTSGSVPRAALIGFLGLLWLTGLWGAVWWLSRRMR